MDRAILSFEDFEEIGYNAQWDTWGVHGVNVLEDGHEIGEIPWVTEAEVEDMTDEELQDLLDEYGILI